MQASHHAASANICLDVQHVSRLTISIPRIDFSNSMVSMHSFSRQEQSPRAERLRALGRMRRFQLEFIPETRACQYNATTLIDANGAALPIHRPVHRPVRTVGHY